MCMVFCLFKFASFCLRKYPILTFVVIAIIELFVVFLVLGGFYYQ